MHNIIVGGGGGGIIVLCRYFSMNLCHHPCIVCVYIPFVANVMHTYVRMHICCRA